MKNRIIRMTGALARGAAGLAVCAATGMTAPALWAAGVVTESTAAANANTAVVAPHVDRTDNGVTGGASASHEQNQSRTVSRTNAGEGELGGTQLQNGQTVAAGSAEVHASGQVQNGLGTVSAQVDGGASYAITAGDNGVQGEFSAGIQAKLEAMSNEMRVGNEDVGASAQVQAKVEALIGAEGKLGAYIDEHGITLGGQARAGAFISAEAEANFEGHFFGVQAQVRVYAEGHAGAMAQGEALVTIGFDGKIKFALGAGLALGFGGSAGIEFEVDASALMEKLGLPDLATLLEWVARFREDPAAAIHDLMGEVANAAIEAAEQMAVDAAHQVIETAESRINDLFDRALNTIDPNNRIHTPADAGALPSPTLRPPTAPGSGGAARGGGSSGPAAGSGGPDYPRNTNYNNWSK